MAEARAILDTANALRLAAAAVGAINPKAAQELTSKAEALYHGGEISKGGNAKDAIEQWEALHGGRSMNDPKFRDEVYEVALKYRKMLAERNQEQRKQQEARARLSADARRRNNSKLRRTRRG